MILTNISFYGYCCHSSTYKVNKILFQQKITLSL